MTSGGGKGTEAAPCTNVIADAVLASEKRKDRPSKEPMPENPMNNKLSRYLGDPIPIHKTYISVQNMNRIDVLIWCHENILRQFINDYQMLCSGKFEIREARAHRNRTCFTFVFLAIPGSPQKVSKSFPHDCSQTVILSFLQVHTNRSVVRRAARKDGLEGGGRRRCCKR